MLFFFIPSFDILPSLDLCPFCMPFFDILGAIILMDPCSEPDAETRTLLTRRGLTARGWRAGRNTRNWPPRCALSLLELEPRRFSDQIGSCVSVAGLFGVAQLWMWILGARCVNLSEE